MKGYISFKKLKNELLKNPELKKEYDRLEPEYKLKEQKLRKRIAKNLR